MKAVVSVLVLLFTSFSYGTVLVPGLYDGPQNSNANCSVYASYDDVRKVLNLSLVNKYDGTFCDTQSFDSESCREHEGELRCDGDSFEATIHNSRAITVSSFYKAHWNFHAINWTAASAPNPTRFRAINDAGWEWSLSNSRCKKIPPHNIEMYCSEIPVELLEGLCPGLQKLAEKRALNNCSNETGQECKLNHSKYIVYQQRKARTYIPKSESGCEWISIAAPI